MTQESLDLLLIVNIPDSHNAVFSAADKILAIRRNSKRSDLIKMALNCSIELFTFKEELFLFL